MGTSQELEFVPNNKSGTLWTAVAHVFCAVVGAGVLGLPNSVAWLGWVAGPLCIIAFFSISLWSSIMLAGMYRIGRIEFARYSHLVDHVLGRKGSIALATFQMLFLVLTCIAYSITGAAAMQTIARYFGSEPNKEWQLVLLMGAIELFFSQLPSLEDIWWVSALGTASSLLYVFIALILGLIYSGNHLGSVGGRAGSSTSQKIFGVFSSLGNIAFAFGFAQVLLEIQDTLRQPPDAQKTMKKASIIAVTGAFGFYFATSVACYSALGNSVAGEVLDGFEQAPNWVLVVANFAIVIHMIMAWQVWAQPVFSSVESHIKAYRIKKQLAAAGASTAPSTDDKLGDGGKPVGAPALGYKSPSGHKPSPFDVHHEVHHLPAVAEADVEDGSPDVLAQAASGLSSLRSRAVSVRASGAMSVVNSAPIPDLVPPGWKRPAHGSHGSLHGLASHDGAAERVQPSGHSAASVLSHLARLSAALGSRDAMYHLETGAANEHVPSNTDHYYLPLWQRLILRSSYVLLCTIVACVVPFFNAIVGLVGAITYWPLSVGFPFLMYAIVKKPPQRTILLMKVVAAVMLVVALLAIVGSAQNIIVSWSSYTFFS